MSKIAETDEQVVVVRMPDAQILLTRDGSATIIEAGKNTVVLKGISARAVKAQYDKFKKAYPDKRILKITLEIEVPYPIGEQVTS